MARVKSNSLHWWLTNPTPRKLHVHKKRKPCHCKFKMSFYCWQKSKTKFPSSFKFISRTSSRVSRVRHNLTDVSCKQHKKKMFKPKKTEKKIFKEMLIERIYLLQRERERERGGRQGYRLFKSSIVSFFLVREHGL